MPVTATGIFSLPLYYGRKTLAGAATFRSLVGAVDATAAEKWIFEGEVDENLVTDESPRAIMAIDSGHRFSRISTTGWQGQGPLLMVLEVPTPAKYRDSRRDARVWWLNTVGAIIAEMQALAGVAGYLNIIEFAEENTGRADPKEENGADFWVSVWHLNWLG